MAISFKQEFQEKFLDSIGKNFSWPEARKKLDYLNVNKTVNCSQLVWPGDCFLGIF